MRVNLMGAFSEGKTTLSRSIGQKYNLTIIPEQARVLAAEREISSISKIRTNTVEFSKFNIEIMTKQFNSEQQAGNDLVSCRGIDCVSFLAFFGCRRALYNLRQEKIYKDYVNWLRGSNLFYILPNQELINDDGFRDTNYELALQISGAVRMICEVEGLDYIPINTSNMADRERMVFSYLDLIRMRENGP